MDPCSPARLSDFKLCWWPLTRSVGYVMLNAELRPPPLADFVLLFSLCFGARQGLPIVREFSETIYLICCCYSFSFSGFSVAVNFAICYVTMWTFSISCWDRSCLAYSGCSPRMKCILSTSLINATSVCMCECKVPWASFKFSVSVLGATLINKFEKSCRSNF